MKIDKEFSGLWPEWILEDEIGRGTESVVLCARSKKETSLKCAFKRISVPGDETELVTP